MRAGSEPGLPLSPPSWARVKAEHLVHVEMSSIHDLVHCLYLPANLSNDRPSSSTEGYLLWCARIWCARAVAYIPNTARPFFPLGTKTVALGNTPFIGWEARHKAGPCNGFADLVPGGEVGPPERHNCLTRILQELINLYPPKTPLIVQPNQLGTREPNLLH